MTAKKGYSNAQKAEYYAGLAAAEGGDKPAKKRPAKRTSARKSGTTATRTRRRVGGKRKFNPDTYKKRSGCFYEESYKDKNGNIVERPKIWGWRIDAKLGFQSFVAYLDKNDGLPRNGTSGEICRVFVVNITTKGLGESKATGVYSMKYKKLSITKLGLVANPRGGRGGYFGRGGSQYRDKV
jgi:hypothetical protein